MSFDARQEAAEVVQETEFYILDIGDGDSIEYYTTNRKPVTTSAFTGSPVSFLPLPMTREGLRISPNLQSTKTRVALPVQPAFIDLIAETGIDEIKLTIIRGFGTDYANDYRNPWWLGRIVDLTTTPTKLIGNLESIEKLFEFTVPNIYHQARCNNELGDSVCGVNVVALEETRTVVSLSNGNRLVILDGTPPANDTFTFGKMKRVTSPTNELWRAVSQQAGPQFVLHTILPGLQVGDEVVIRPGCGGRIQEDCIDRFNNKTQAVAMPEISEVNPVVDGV